MNLTGFTSPSQDVASELGNDNPGSICTFAFSSVRTGVCRKHQQFFAEIRQAHSHGQKKGLFVAI